MGYYSGGRLMSEDLNRKHSVTLTEGQISTILYILEGYIQGNDDEELVEKLEDICYRIDKKLEPVVNNEEKTIDYRGNSYAENVDALVARMGSGWH